MPTEEQGVASQIDIRVEAQIRARAYAEDNSGSDRFWLIRERNPLCQADRFLNTAAPSLWRF